MIVNITISENSKDNFISLCQEFKTDNARYE